MPDTDKKKTLSKKIISKKTRQTKTVKNIVVKKNRNLKIEPKKKDKKNIFLSEIKSKNTLRLIVIFLVLMFLLIVVNFLSILRIRKELKNYLTSINSITINSSEKGESQTDLWIGLGDHFSSFAYLDKNKTDMFLDETVAALIFPPLFSMDKKNDLADLNLDENYLINNNWILSDEKKYCLSLERNCLEPRNEKELVFNGRKIDLPQEVAQEKIKKIDVSRLSSLFLVSFVCEYENQERVYTYFFNGSSYTPLIGKNSPEKIITEHGRLNGSVSASGSDDNFLLFYAGYEGRAFHYRQEKLIDISKYFGLRVLDGGFNPVIFKQGEGKNSLWYILSLDRKKPRLIKLWQNETLDIQGAHDFSYIFKDFSHLDFISFRENKNRGEIEFIFSPQEKPLLGKNEPGLWVFKDAGFDNLKPRKSFSANFNNKNKKIIEAFIENMSFNSGLGSPASFGDKYYPEIYFLGSDFNKQKAGINERVYFPLDNKELYLEIIFNPATSSEYSPFFDHISHLYFLTRN